MNVLSRVRTRRDRCLLIGRRARKLTRDEAACAWWGMAIQVEDLGERDVPKFVDLLRAIRGATVAGKMVVRKEREQGIILQ